MRHAIRSLLPLLLLAGAGFSQSVLAADSNTLKDISYTTGAGGSVQLHLNFAGAVPQPRIFTTDNPARIAIDFADTGTTAQRHTDIGQGATSGVSAVSAGGRTRVIVELMRPASYQSAVEGDSLVLTVAGGGASGAPQSASAPTQRSVTTAAIIDPSKHLPAAVDGAISVTNIDFRRGSDGQGRVLVNFSGTGADAQMHTIGDKVVVSIPNANVPSNLTRRLDTMDFATPVQSITTRVGAGGGVQMTIATKGVVDTSAYQEGNQYVVEVAPKRGDNAAVGASLAALDQHPAYNGKRATFNFQDIPVRSVLQLIADTSGLNIVAADSVAGSITLRLVNVPWDQALDVILRAKGLDKRQDGNVIWVAPQQELAKYEEDVATARMKAEDNAPLVTTYIPISYGKAADIAKLLTTGSLQGMGGGTSANTTHGFLSARGSVSSDDRTNTLLLNDTADKTEQIRKLVAVLDRPVQQVLIESRIVIASDSFTRQLGVQWGAYAQRVNPSGQVLQTGGGAGGTTLGWSTPGSTTTSTSSGGVSSNPGLVVNLPASTGTSPAGSLGFAILGKNYALDLELSAAQTEGNTETIASPRVITANQQEAVIRQGQEIGYVTYQGGAGASASTGTATVQFKDAVLQLKVTPTITADNRVYLMINVNKDTLAQFLQTPQGQVPEINTQSVNTSVLVDNGQTVVLGGIYEVDKSNTVTKVPGLGDIPILGVLFRSTSRNNSKAELLIFVTPRILNDSLQ
ncbi:type IV pilus secretin PilQ [Rhodanobacter sp. DHB23]|uniref:type IV pilus secretin PilQ n=1 Tax=Rhodanobacter sp. DHB23 TaxID=2775923 RepID=UPI00178091B0|nr:type IV pilus secretin PilQ [Rhodanobacter sp. DHB23]MBD8872808.1 type IV pilus secretin PilQ [Rhodanobacter sp. DHB23]